jgi:deoxyadenosine/deoxycytidine kinase
MLNVFASMLADDNIMTPIEIKFYKEMFNDDVRCRFYPDKILYLTTSVDTCMERINTRSRENENTITKEYVTKCDQYHRKWLDEMYDAGENDDLVYLDPDNIDLLHLQNVLEKMLYNS